jgi:hypothetical protein
VLLFLNWLGNTRLVWRNHEHFINRNNFGSIGVSTAWLRRTVNLKFLRHNSLTRKKDDTIFPLWFFFPHILGLKWGLICIIQKKTISQYPKATNAGVDLNHKLFGVWKDNEISLPQHLSEDMFITYRRFWIENVTNFEGCSAFYSVIKEFSSFWDIRFYINMSIKAFIHITLKIIILFLPTLYLSYYSHPGPRVVFYFLIYRRKFYFDFLFV